jgi:hypothetical protein
MAIEKKIVDYIPVIGVYTFNKRLSQRNYTNEAGLFEEVDAWMGHSVYHALVTTAVLAGGLAASLLK